MLLELWGYFIQYSLNEFINLTLIILAVFIKKGRNGPIKGIDLEYIRIRKMW